MTRRKRRLTTPAPRLALVPAAALVVIALLIAGCGGSSGGDSSGSASDEGPSTTAGGGSQAGGPGGFEISDQARACLKEKGVELPEPGEGGGPPSGGEPPAGFEPPAGGEPPQGGGAPEGFGGGEMGKAFEECGVELPQGKPGGQGKPNTNSAAFKAQIEEYTACVRENGYELPEPDLSGKGPVFSESEVDQSDPKFKQASEACQSKLGAPGGGGESE